VIKNVLLTANQLLLVRVPARKPAVIVKHAPMDSMLLNVTPILLMDVMHY
jgi:hypothetical protein